MKKIATTVGKKLASDFGKTVRGIVGFLGTLLLMHIFFDKRIGDKLLFVIWLT